MGEARAAYYAMAPQNRVSAQLFLIATGDFNAMISRDFGGRLYDAVASFQRKHDLEPTGVLDDQTWPLLQREGGGILSSWQMHGVDHPTQNASLSVPGSPFGLQQLRTQRGLAFENNDGSMSVDFAFFPAEEADLGDIYARLLAPAADKRIDMHVIRADFFAIASGGESYGAYSRFIVVPGGSVGFTLKWNTKTYVNGIRVAVVMANSLLPSRAAPPDGAADAVAMAGPSREASLEQAPHPVGRRVSTGSAFYVSATGELVTNDHVVRDCSDAVVTGRGAARIVARDVRNDLALLRLASKPAEPTGAVRVRAAPLQLGEPVYVSGFPYAGALDNGVNFTNGLVSSVAGMNNDSTAFQMTAAVQPGSSGGPVLDQGGALVGMVVSRMNDTAAFNATKTIPQSVNFGLKSDVVTSFLRANGVTPSAAETNVAVLPTTEVAALSKAVTAQVTCVSHQDD